MGSTSGSSGELIFQVPTSMTQLHLATFSVFGTTNINAVVTISDNTTEQVATNFTIQDWFNGGSVLHTLNGRVIFSGTVYNQFSGNPRIYTYSFNITAE